MRKQVSDNLSCKTCIVVLLVTANQFFIIKGFIKFIANLVFGTAFSEAEMYHVRIITKQSLFFMYVPLFIFTKI